jgi:hypothetical protein
MFRRLCWPADKGCARDRSLRCEHDESFKQGGRCHGRVSSPSPVPRRSRECSIDRLLHHFRQRDTREEKDNEAMQLPAPSCKSASPKPSDNSGSNGHGVAVSPLPHPTDEVYAILSLSHPGVPSISQLDPMLQEAAMMQVCALCLPPELRAAFAMASQTLDVATQRRGHAKVGDVASPIPALAAPLQANSTQPQSSRALMLLTAPPANTSACALAEPDEELQGFIKGVSTNAPKPILRTPTKKPKATKELEAPSVKRSGRPAAKAHAKGIKSYEELAQEILSKKLEGAPGQ